MLCSCRLSNGIAASTCRRDSGAA